MNRRQLILIAGLAVTLFLVWWTSRQDDAPDAGLAEPVTHRAVAAAVKPASRQAAARSDRHAERTSAFAGGDLFPAQSWKPPPPPPPPQPAGPPPEPVAPPLPFKLLGSWQDGDDTTYFLADGTKDYSVRKGDAVGPWRLDDTARGLLSFTYTPLNKTQTMRVAQ